jgi:hypothetical protein
MILVNLNGGLLLILLLLYLRSVVYWCFVQTTISDLGQTDCEKTKDFSSTVNSKHSVLSCVTR